MKLYDSEMLKKCHDLLSKGISDLDKKELLKGISGLEVSAYENWQTPRLKTYEDLLNDYFIDMMGGKEAYERELMKQLLNLDALILKRIKNETNKELNS